MNLNQTPLNKTFHGTKLSRGLLALAAQLLHDDYEAGNLERVIAAGVRDASEVARFLPGMELGMAVALMVNALGAPASEGLHAGIDYGQALVKSGRMDLALVEITKPD